MVNETRLVNSFVELVKIDSESGHETTISKFLQRKLKTLGVKVYVDRPGNIHGEFTRSNPENTTPSATLLFSAHLDTVKPGKGIIPQVSRELISSSGDTVLGADDKSGIAEILEMLTILKENNLPSCPIHLLFTVSEEVGLQGSRNLEKSDLKADYGLVLDTGGPIGTVINAAPAHEFFSITIKGKAAHAGIEPEKGVNAIVVASNAIAKLTFGRIDEETTANIGNINGGQATNIVPDEVTLNGEVRSHNEEKLQENMKNIKHVFETECKAAGAKLKLTKNREYSAYKLEPDHEIIKLCKTAAGQAKLTFRLGSTGGGSDANNLNQLGIPSLVLSTGMQKVHTTDEFIKISDMVKAVEFILGIVSA